MFLDLAKHRYRHKSVRFIGTFQTIVTGRDLSLHHDRPLNYNGIVLIHTRHLRRLIHRTGS